MYRFIIPLACVALAASAAEPATKAPAPAGPVQLYVRGNADGCDVRFEPGAVDLKVLFPDARVVHKNAKTDRGQAVHSCEVDIARSKFAERYAFCALAAHGDGWCSVSFSYAGGREVEFTLSGSRKETICGYVCPAGRYY